MRSCKFSDPEHEVDLVLSRAGVPADLDPPRFGPPGPNPPADMDPLVQIRQRIWTPGPNPLADMDPSGPNPLADMDPPTGPQQN